MKFIKIILLTYLTMLFILQVPSYSMDLEDEESSIRQRLISRDDSEILTSDEEAAIPAPDSFEVKDDPLKAQINAKLRPFLFPESGKSFFGTECPPLETAVIVYHANYKPELGSWDDPVLFAEELDRILFTQSKSYLTRGVQIILSVSGGMAPWGWGPLTMFLAQNIVWSSEIPGSIPLIIAYSTIATSTIPCIQQMIDRGALVGNALFDHNGFYPSKSDKKPHVRKLKKEVELPFAICGKPRYIPIPIQTLCRLVALSYGAIQTSFYIPAFYDAEYYFPIYFGVLVGPLGVMLFEKAYSESLESLEFISHRYFTNQFRMERQKKEILSRRLLDLKALINARGSNQLVEKLYSEFQCAMQLHKDGRSVRRISAASLFFLKRMENPTFNTLRDMIEEANLHMEQRHEDATLEMDTDHPESHASHSSIQELEQMGEVVQSMRGIPIAEAMHLIEDISQLPGITTMRRLLEYLAIRIPGIAEASRFLIPLWAIPEIFYDFGVTNVSVNILGAEIDPIFCGALTVSFAQLLIRAASEWYLQNEAYLELRRFGSTSSDFWPLRWAGNILSILPSAMGALAGPAILFNLLGDSPVYVKVILSAAIFPGDMVSFYRFFSKKYGNFIRSLTTNFVRTTSQRRGVLNDEIENLYREIQRFDDTTTNEFYKHVEKGL